MEEKISRRIGALAQRIAKELYKERNYRISGTSGFKWWDFVAKRPGDEFATAVQVKGTVTRYPECYPISYDYLEGQIDKFLRCPYGFGEYQFVVVSFERHAAFIYSRGTIQSHLYEAQQESKIYDHTGIVALPWKDCLSAHALSPADVAEARWIVASDKSKPAITGDLFIDTDY